MFEGCLPLHTHTLSELIIFCCFYVLQHPPRPTFFIVCTNQKTNWWFCNNKWIGGLLLKKVQNTSRDYCRPFHTTLNLRNCVPSSHIIINKISKTGSVEFIDIKSTGGWLVWLVGVYVCVCMPSSFIKTRSAVTRFFFLNSFFILNQKNVKIHELANKKKTLSKKHPLYFDRFFFSCSTKFFWRYSKMWMCIINVTLCLQEVAAGVRTGWRQTCWWWWSLNVKDVVL